MTIVQSTSEQLIEANQGLLISLARQIARKSPGHVEWEDLLAYGQLGLAEAARDFDSARGNSFSTYAYYKIRGAIYDGLSKMTWGSRAQYRQARTQRLADDVLANQPEAGDPNTPAGLAREVAWFRGVSTNLAVVSLLASTEGEAGEGRAGTGDVIDQRAVPPLSAAADREIADRLRELVAALPDPQGPLIRRVYFEGLTLEEAGRGLGISKSWASRVHARALEHLARELKRLGADT